MKKIKGLQKGMGIGGWLTNYKRFNVLPNDRRLVITIGDMEHFESYITEDDVKYIASLGLDHIRLGFDQIVVEESPYIYRENILDIMYRFSDWCDKYNLRLVLNLHKAIGNYCDILEEKGLFQFDELQERFMALWLKLEEKFSDKPDVMFELLNEVVNASAEEWNSLAERCVNAIRAINPTRYIILGGIEWGNPPGLNEIKVFDDENIIYTFHSYAPFEFTHQQSVLSSTALYYNRKMPYPTDDVERYRDFYRTVFDVHDSYKDDKKIDIDFLRRQIAPAVTFIKNNPDKIVWCGEFGTIRHCNIKYRENWMRDMITILKENDIPYSVWNYLSTPNDGNKFSLVDDDNRQIVSEEMARIIRGEV